VEFNLIYIIMSYVKLLNKRNIVILDDITNNGRHQIKQFFYDNKTEYMHLSPDSVYNSMKVPDKDNKNVILKELVLALYKEEILSFGKARELAGLSKEEFHDLLEKKEIERHYSLNNLKEDINYGEY